MFDALNHCATATLKVHKASAFVILSETASSHDTGLFDNDGEAIVNADSAGANFMLPLPNRSSEIFPDVFCI